MCVVIIYVHVYDARLKPHKDVHKHEKQSPREMDDSQKCSSTAYGSDEIEGSEICKRKDVSFRSGRD